MIDTRNDKALEEIIHQYQGIFMANDWDIGCTNLLRHRIETTGGPLNKKTEKTASTLRGQTRGSNQKSRGKWNNKAMQFTMEHTNSMRLEKRQRRNQTVSRFQTVKPNYKEICIRHAKYSGNDGWATWNQIFQHNRLRKRVLPSRIGQGITGKNGVFH
jgi:hypothetical protein